MKSGPGPKNGEQYGAPFREEEWGDGAADDSFMDQNDGEDMSPANLISNSTPVTFNIEGCDSFPVNELEDLLRNLSQEQEFIPGDPEFSTYTSEVSKVRSRTPTCWRFSDVDQTGYVYKCILEFTVFDEVTLLRWRGV